MLTERIKYKLDYISELSLFSPELNVNPIQRPIVAQSFINENLNDIYDIHSYKSKLK